MRLCTTGTDVEGAFPVLPEDALSPLARWLSKTLSGDFSDALCVRMTLALAVHLFDLGHTCIVLRHYAGRNFPSDAIFGVEESLPEYNVLLPDAETWRCELLASGACVPFTALERTVQPLVWYEGERGFSVALTRHAWREVSIAKALADLASSNQAVAESSDDPKLTVEQNMAVTCALANRFTVISGGPGTGKTTTVASLVARLVKRNSSVVVKMAAPSGKAAARMTESFRSQSGPLREAGILPADYVVENAATLHRLLGVSADGQRVFRTADSPILADVVIVDEASMVSAELMKYLLDALAPSCKLILLGDMNQLKSVEPGNVLGAICREAKNNADSIFTLCVHVLTKSFRFSDEKHVGRLARAIVEAAPDRVLTELRKGEAPLTWKARWNPTKDGPAVYELLFNALREADFANPQAALAAMESSRILCAQNSGRYGAVALNDACARHLVSMRPNDCNPRPIIILENDYDQHLFNGDTGVVMKDPATKGERAFFRAGSADALSPDGTRTVPMALLPTHALAYAMTVHKSQGSEYSHLAVVIPPYETRLLSRSLLYTAVTRFRESDDASLLIAAPEDIVRTAVSREVEFDSLFPAALASVAASASLRSQCVVCRE